MPLLPGDRKHGAEWTTAEYGSNGPFMLTDKKAERAWCGAQSYLQPAGGRRVQRVECRTCEAIWQALEPYERGELDLVSLLNADPATLDKAARSHPGEIVSIPQPSVLYLAFRSDRAPFDDPLLRKAFIHAVDRRELAREAYQESHRAATGGFVPPGMVGHSPDIGLGYDPELARAVKQAGFAAVTTRITGCSRRPPRRAHRRS
jgi:ABC-type transport system substrate-binding protein